MSAPTPRSPRRGVNLAEFIVFFAASLMIIGYGWDIVRQGSIMGSTTHEGLNLQAGVRNFMENLVKDVNASVYIAEPHGLTTTPGNRVVVWVFDDDKEDSDGGMVDLTKRILYNDGPTLPNRANPWPFHHTDGPTRWHLPVIQVTYEWNPSSQKMTRTAIQGELYTEAGQGQVFVNGFSFHPKGGAKEVERVVSENIEEFEVYPFGYDETMRDDVTHMGALRPTSELPDAVSGLASESGPLPAAGFGRGISAFGGTGAPTGTTERIARTAMLLVKVKAVFDYDSPKYRDPEFFMATKIWSYAKLYEHRYFPYFSSVDDDLRY